MPLRRRANFHAILSTLQDDNSRFASAYLKVIRTVAMVKGDYKLIWYIGYPGYDNVYELYDIASDPEELVDLSESRSDIVLSMGNELKMRLAQADQPYSVKV